MKRYKYLSEDFLQAMDEIGELGFERYKENSFHVQSHNERTIERHQTVMIAAHAHKHIDEYVSGIKHDHFNDEVHQLAAAAFNLMVEAQFAKLVKD